LKRTLFGLAEPKAMVYHRQVPFIQYPVDVNFYFLILSLQSAAQYVHVPSYKALNGWASPYYLH